jgi:hypothetical protein
MPLRFKNRNVAFIGNMFAAFPVRMFFSQAKLGRMVMVFNKPQRKSFIDALLQNACGGYLGLFSTPALADARRDFFGFWGIGFGGTQMMSEKIPRVFMAHVRQFIATAASAKTVRNFGYFAKRLFHHWVFIVFKVMPLKIFDVLATFTGARRYLPAATAFT